MLSIDYSRIHISMDVSVSVLHQITTRSTVEKAKVAILGHKRKLVDRRPSEFEPNLASVFRSLWIKAASDRSAG